MELHVHKLKSTDGMIECSFEADIGNSFAYYVYKNGKRIDTVWYKPVLSDIVSFVYKPISSGTYSIRVFIKDKDGNIVDKYSNAIFMDTWAGETIETTYKNEQVFYLDIPVRYLFQPSKNNSPHLVIVFSGLHTNEYSGGNPVYNYVRTLNEFDCNKLFILDEYKGQFCYYLGHGCRHDYEKAVIALIAQIANKLNISAKNIISCGSSKGGTAALYYGIKYQFGNVISGAPQILIANFLKGISHNNPVIQKALDNMAGEDKDNGVAYINNLFFDLIEQTESFPELYLHIGKGDYHMDEHIKPFLEKLKDVKYSIDIQEYSDHGMTGTYFSPYLVKMLETVLKQKNVKQSEHT